MRTTKVQEVLSMLVAEGRPSDEAPLVWVTDLGELDRSLDALANAFPAGTLHAVAVKANTEAAVLQRVADRGFGFEAASAGELALSLQLVGAGRVVFDSPAKTRTELAAAVGASVRINVDSMQELARLRELTPAGFVGVRINPGGRQGAIADTSTAVPGSKFGVDLQHDGRALLTLLPDLGFVDGLHVHVGSQGGDLSLLVEGARQLVAFAMEVEARGRPIHVLDIGGGLSVDYHQEHDEGALERWVAAIRAGAPELFDGRWRLVTELGRFVHARHSIAVSRVEYTKRSGDRRIAVIHVGADALLRAVYRPDLWSHRLSVFDSKGRPKLGPLEPWDIAGPLCFSGDLVARDRELPAIAQGDLVVVHDVGAYTLSMWSAYNSRARPTCVAV